MKENAASGCKEKELHMPAVRGEQRKIGGCYIDAFDVESGIKCY